MKLLFAIFMIIISTSALAQGSLKEGNTQLDLGLGFSSWGIPIYIGFDYGVHKDITIGGEFAYRSFKEDNNKKTYSKSVFGLSGNLNYHFNNILRLPKIWDLYAGLNIGILFWTSESENSSGLGLGAQFGTRYFLSDKFGLNMEFGGGNRFSGGKFGITYKM
ncbi:MAG: hypothetical protein HW421_3309 [Ignavibacteria bacterium]|nr:hypothetical protein [Ignavibacteria bacterium]